MKTWMRTAPALVALVLVAGCRQGDVVQPGPGPGQGGEQLFVASDPPGANITLDGVATGQITPDTVQGIQTGQHTVGVVLASNGLQYGYEATLDFGADAPASVTFPLLARCGTSDCLSYVDVQHDAAGIRFTSSGVGMPFYLTGTTAGLVWPDSTTDGYVAGAAAIFAGKPAPDSSPVSVGVYPFNGTYPPYWLGRPASGESTSGGTVTVRQTTWISPPPIFVNYSTARGLAVDQTITGRADLPDMLLVHLVFRNISARESYRVLDPVVPAVGITYTEAYIGFGMDADVGTADNDQVSYAPDLDLVYTYDADFYEYDFLADSTQPGIVGLRLLRAPPGTSTVLNAWPLKIGLHNLDWYAGNQNEAFGWEMMSGTQTLLPNDPSPKVGYVPNLPDDYRMEVSVGPLTLAPGDSAAIDVAVVIARPAPGTYTPHQVVAPGDPFDDTRPLAAIAAPLVQRARDAEQLLH